MADSVPMTNLTWPEFEARVKDDLVIFCRAARLSSTAITEGVARQVGDLVTTAITYGYKSMPKSGGSPGFPGTINLDGATLVSVVGDIIRDIHRHGLRKVCAIVGHYENQWFVGEGIDLALREIGDADLKAMRLEYWDFCTPAVLGQVFPDGYPGVELEHAVVMETSLMLHLYPDKVRKDLIPDHPPAEFPPYDVYPVAEGWVPWSGALTTAKGSTAVNKEFA